MQDYPVDGLGGMSQLHHSEKMTTGLPGSVVSPAAKVDGVVYFVDELLQLKSGEYFIPERFFQGEPQKDRRPFVQGIYSTWREKEYELYAVGRMVQASEVCVLPLFSNKTSPLKRQGLVLKHLRRVR